MSDGGLSPLAVRQKTRQVVAHHQDDATPGKPLFLLIPGGAFALASLGLIVWLLYSGLYARSTDATRAVQMALLLAPVYAGSVFLFSYGYELYDLGKALRLAGIIVFFTFASVLIVAVLFSLFSSSSSSSSKSSDSSTSGSSEGHASGGLGIGDVMIVGSGSTRTIEREVIREVPVPAQPEPPEPIACPYCRRLYVPQQTGFQCPGCGAATQQEAVSAKGS